MPSAHIRFDPYASRLVRSAECLTMHSVSFSNSLSLLTASVICMGIASGINHFLDGVSYENKMLKKERTGFSPA